MDKDNNEEQPPVTTSSPTGTPPGHLVTRACFTITNKFKGQMSPSSNPEVAPAGPSVPGPALESTGSPVIEGSILKVGEGPDIIPLNPTEPGKPDALMECPNCAGLYVPIILNETPPLDSDTLPIRVTISPKESPIKGNLADLPVVNLPVGVEPSGFPVVEPSGYPGENWTPLPPIPVEYYQQTKPVATVTTTTAGSSIQGQQSPEMGKIKILQREKKELPSTSQELPSTSQELPSTSQEQEPKSEFQPIPTEIEEASPSKKKGKKKWRPLNLRKAATESDPGSSSRKPATARGNRKRSSSTAAGSSRDPGDSGQEYQEEKKAYRGRKKGDKK